MADTKTPSGGDEPVRWTYKLFDCCGEPGLCLCTFCLPCYTIGRNAEFFSEEGPIVGLMYGLGVIALGPMLRARIREHKNIQGNMLSDAVIHCLCPCCSLIQENRELFGGKGSHLGEKIPLNQDMARQ